MYGNFCRTKGASWPRDELRSQVVKLWRRNFDSENYKVNSSSETYVIRVMLYLLSR